MLILIILLLYVFSIALVKAGKRADDKIHDLFNKK